MKLFKIVFLITMFSISTNIEAYSLDLKSNQAYLMNYRTGEVLYKKNEEDRIHPSSLTKIMTSYIVFDALKNGELTLPYRYTVSKEAWEQEGSRMFLEIGSRPSIDELLKGLIIQSGNDAAYTLAEATSPNVSRFVEAMNLKAKELKLKNTNFTNPMGFNDLEHYMSVEDTALLSRYLIKNYPQYYRKYFSEKEYKYNNILQQNRNKLLTKYSGVDGIKTGKTDLGGYGMAVSARRGGRRLIAVVNGANSEAEREEDSKKLLNYGFSKVKTFKLFSANEVLPEAIPVLYGKTYSLKVKVLQDIYATAEYKNDIKIQIKISGKLTAPISINEEVGNIIITTKYDRFVYSLYAANEVKSVNILEKFLIKLYEKIQNKKTNN